MVNLWPGIPTQFLCDKHLNAAINEGLNLLVRYQLKRHHRITGWVNNGCIKPTEIIKRIDDLITESKRRGKDWSYTITDSDREIVAEYEALDIFGEVVGIDNYDMIVLNRVKLAARCSKCNEKLFPQHQ